MVWNELDNKDKAGALAELLGWQEWGGPLSRWWRDSEGHLLSRVDDFKPRTDWRSMGLVVEAMVEKGWIVDIRIMSDRAECIISPRQEVGDPAANTTYVVAGRAPAAVAEAAYEALGGKQSETT